ncbi:anti-sigma factor [Sphingomonas sp. SUN039]|uniref:anti-sigma factor n=1 Tax=Sphingomonas sp. SUN039 TaxID=2937787 RepID=UPI002164A05E|nr:anti-sigma factor [Sphingomonas sp. SUN039]UVO54152.1 anti-sigma factor [Sphingomonas sp. SUN039]
MTSSEPIDDEMLMAYADGELGPLEAKRVERAMADDPALAAAVEAHRALRQRLDTAFAPILAAPVPDRLAAMLDTNVVPFAPRPVAAPSRRRWLGGLAVAASLVAGIALGTQWPGAEGPVSAQGSTLVASGTLAKSLDTQLASAAGETRILASFRAQGGGYCRVFAAPALDGIACRNGGSWQLRQTRAPAMPQDAAYRQAASGDAALLAAAQEMMAGDPLDAATEARARAAGWK